MADIFLSYAKEDRDVARDLSALLERAGWTVWWDRRIPAGRTWRDVLEEALGSMRCMIVLWSSHSIESDWVKEEAEEARAVKKLVPVLIETVNAPVGFRTIQAADLTQWDGVSESGGASQLIADLETLIGRPSSRVAQDHEPNVAVERAAGPASTAASGMRVEAERGIEYRRASRQARTGKVGMRWKAIAAAGVALALLLGGLALWPDRQPEQKDVTVVSTPPTAESPPAPKLLRLDLTAARRELKPAETLGLNLRGHFSDGSESEINSGIEWSSSNPQVATVNAQGRVTATQPGSTNITATHGGHSSTSLTVAVKSAQVKAAPAAQLVALTVTGIKKDLAPRERIALRVTGGFSDGSEKNLADGIVWLSSDAAVASVNAKGELAARRAGKTEVVARLGDVTSAPLSVLVKAPALESATAPRERKSVDYMTGRIPVYSAVEKAPEAPPPAGAEQLSAKISSYINRAKTFRVQGNYGAALAELAAARAVDPGSAEIRAEIEQTKRACLAEKSLGRGGLDCG